MVQTYLSSAIDDHSRYVIQSEFYDNQEKGIVEDTLRKAVLKAGKFDACYFDRGSQYIAKQLNLSLSRLGITVRLAPPASGQSKGKVEKFHQVVGHVPEGSKSASDPDTGTAEPVLGDFPRRVLPQEAP